MNRLPQALAILFIATLITAKLTAYLDLSWILIVLLSTLVLIGAELFFWICFVIACVWIVRKP